MPSTDPGIAPILRSLCAVTPSDWRPLPGLDSLFFPMAEAFHSPFRDLLQTLLMRVGRIEGWVWA